MNRCETIVTAFLTLVLCVPGYAEDGILDLGPAEFVRAGGIDIVVPGYSVPSFEDWNNDGLRDLIVGEGGSSPGKVRVYLNVGTAASPRFSDYVYVQANGKDLSVTPQGCQGAFPRALYWDDDDRKDLLVGLSDGTAMIFLNVADANEPAFDAGKVIRVGTNEIWPLDVGARATPTVVDWNGDGMLDIVSGGLDGVIHIYQNCGCGGSIPPRFYFATPDGYPFAQAGGRDLTVPGGRSSPEFMDLDGDGKKDLLTGNTDGLILFYRNIGTESLPEFSPYVPVKSNGVAIDLPDALRTRPALCHWTGDGQFGPKDGYWDLLVGYGDGKVRLYRGLPKAGDFDLDGDLDGDDFGFLAKALDKPIPLEGTAADLNADGVVDTLDLRLFADLWLAANP